MTNDAMTDDAATDAIAREPLVRGEGVAAWRQIADALGADIVAARLPPGAQLPPEQALARRFAVNRHTVRRAIAALAADGMVRATQGRGTFVEAQRLPYPIGTRTRFTENVARAGREADGALLSAIEKPAQAAVAAALGVEPGAALLALTTVRTADGAPLSYGTSSFPLPRFSGLAAAFETAHSITQALAACGVADYRRIETKVSARIATATDAARLELAPGRVVLVVDSVNVDTDGTPIQATRAVFPADRVEIVLAGDPLSPLARGEDKNVLTPVRASSRSSRSAACRRRSRSPPP